MSVDYGGFPYPSGGGSTSYDPNAAYSAYTSGAGATSEWQAWYGSTRSRSSAGLGMGHSRDDDRRVTYTSSDRTVGEGQHNANFYDLWKNANWRTQIIQVGLKMGYSANDTERLNYLWNQAGRESAALLASGKKMTPMQILKFWGGSVGGMGGSGGGGGGGGGYRSTSTNTSYDISDAKTAKAITNAVLSAALGREATEDDLATYKKALNAYEKANPSVSTTVTTGDGSGNSSSTSTSKGGATGAGREQVLKDRAMESTEGQAYFTQNVFQAAMERLAQRIG